MGAGVKDGNLDHGWVANFHFTSSRPRGCPCSVKIPPKSSDCKARTAKLGLQSFVSTALSLQLCLYSFVFTALSLQLRLYGFDCKALTSRPRFYSFVFAALSLRLLLRDYFETLIRTKSFVVAGLSRLVQFIYGGIARYQETAIVEMAGNHEQRHT